MSIARLRIAVGPGVRGGHVAARALVEDALRTEACAAGPAAARGLLVLRRLDAGRIRAQSDRTAAQRRVGGALAEAGRRAVHPLHPGAAEADAVLFRDPLEAYALYAEALFRGSRLRDAWFFQAVFGRRPDLSVTSAGRRLLLRAADESFAPLAVAEVIVRAGPLAAPLVASLSSAEAAAALGRIAAAEASSSRRAELAAGPAASQPMERGETAAVPWPALLPARLRAAAPDVAERFGWDDSRTQLMVAAALIGVLAAPVSRSLVAHAARAMGRSASFAAQPDEPPQPSPVERVAKEPAGPQVGAADPVRSRPSIPPPPNGEAGLPETRRAAAPATPADLDESPPSGQEPPEPPRQKDDPAESRDRPAAAEPTASSPVSGAERAEEVLFVWPDHEAATAATAAPTAAEPGPWGEPTAWAGAVLVVSAINRVLMPLVASPGAMDAGLGRRLLDTMLRRAGCAARDPARTAFGPAARGLPPAGPLAFHLPAAFDIFGAGDLVLHRLEGCPGWRALTCRRGRVVLALWAGRAPAPVRSRAACTSVRRGRALASDPMPAILTTAELTIRAWLRRATGYRVGGILGRSGWVRATRSHLDVTFDAGLVDLAIRRAGLDLDAGWCPWLFRVVGIHYDYRGHDA